uniref:Uncharacterized protein n=1 Tax=Pongo abelii TaxID=9601 RepID=A0A8I5TV48_PONAB
EALWIIGISQGQQPSVGSWQWREEELRLCCLTAVFVPLGTCVRLFFKEDSRGKEAPCYESDIYEAVAVATSESTTVEPGKLDVGATEGQDLQHISNQKTPTGPPEDRLSLKFLPPSEEDDDAKILPPPVQGSSEDNLNLVCPPRSEDYDGDDIEAQLLQLPVLGSSEDKLSLVCLPPSDVDDLDDECC